MDDEIEGLIMTHYQTQRAKVFEKMRAKNKQVELNQIMMRDIDSAGKLIKKKKKRDPQKEPQAKPKKEKSRVSLKEVRKKIADLERQLGIIKK